MLTHMVACANRGGRALRAAGRAVRRAARRSDGNAVVEAAFLLPVFLSFILGVVEVGRLFWTQSTLQFAVQEAARCASIDTAICGSTSAIQAYAVSKATNLNVAASAFSVTTSSCGNMVQISRPFDFIAADLFPVASITLSAQSCYPK
jgi:Flp pilus assembly protein TadG